MSTQVRIELNPEAFARLLKAGVAECRPVGMQAQVLLLRSLGLAPQPFTPPSGPEPAPEGIASAEERPDDPVSEEAA